MTTLILTFLLERELKRLNRIIDEKIDQGKPYRQEARVHKQLVDRINKIRQQGTVLAMF